MVEAYGLTETIAAAMNPVENTRHNSIGVPMPGTEMRIVDEETGTKENPPGTPGEIIVKGAQVMQGYWENPEATAKIMRTGPDGTEGWFYSGDIGTMDEDGFFHIVDRKNDMIIAGGYNIYPAEVEAVLFEHPAVLEAAVFGVPHAVRGETVKTAIVLKPGMGATEDEIAAFCKERLAPTRCPRSSNSRKNCPSPWWARCCVASFGKTRPNSSSAPFCRNAPSRCLASVACFRTLPGAGSDFQPGRPFPRGPRTSRSSIPGFPHDRFEHILVGRVLGAGRVGVGDPDGGQAEGMGKGVIGNRAAQIGQHGHFFAAGTRQDAAANRAQGSLGSRRVAMKSRSRVPVGW